MEGRTGEGMDRTTNPITVDSSAREFQVHREKGKSSPLCYIDNLHIFKKFKLN